MKKQLLLFALLSITATQINASRRVFELIYEGSTERYNEDFNTYKNNVIEAINNSINIDMEPAGTVYKSNDQNGNPTLTTLNTLLHKAENAEDEDEVQAIDYHYQNTLYLIHQQH